MLRRHEPYHSLLAVLMLCSALAGCGQKGPLFLPPVKATPSAKPPAAATTAAPATITHRSP